MARHGNATERTGRSIRIDDEHWHKLRELAYQRHQSVSGVIRDILVQYLGSKSVIGATEELPPRFTTVEWFAHNDQMHGGKPDMTDTCLVCNDVWKNGLPE